MRAIADLIGFTLQLSLALVELFFALIIMLVGALTALPALAMLIILGWIALQLLAIVF